MWSFYPHSDTEQDEGQDDPGDGEPLREQVRFKIQDSNIVYSIEVQIFIFTSL